MRVSTWLRPIRQWPQRRTPFEFGRRRRGKPRSPGETVAFDIIQAGNSISVEGDGIHIGFCVEGIELLPETDASFAVWGLLPIAMEEGFNIQINRPIDPQVAANAERLSRIWEMWVPSGYRCCSVSGMAGWYRAHRHRMPCIQLYSGGVDSTFAILKQPEPRERGYVLTVYGLDYRRGHGSEARFAKLIAKTDPLLERLNLQRLIVRTNAERSPQKLTHGFTLAACTFLLSDLFEEAVIAADLTEAEDMVAFPWGTNHITNRYLTGSDFTLRTDCIEVGRSEKLAAIVASEIGLPFLSCCRQESAFPENCGTCSKCVRTKSMLLVTMGSVPEIFVDNTVNENLIEKLDLNNRFERAELFDLYHYAKQRGLEGKVPGLLRLIQECRYRKFD